MVPRKLRAAALGEIAAGIVHDANNALTVAVWNIERAARGIAPGTKEAASAKTAIDAAMKAARLLQLILDYAGHTVYEAGVVDPNEILARLAALAPRAGLAVRFEPDARAGPAAVDAAMLELALLDAVATLALHMNGDGALAMRVSEAETGEIVLSFLCTGLAVAHLPEAELELARHVAARAGGRIAVADRGGGRCEVLVYLPRAASTGDGVIVS
ncbi:MAG TPA: hypothetical protein VN632_01665 [Stellaceae bacterium]|nr:hypothetical protein [Stellaceae bacterium]